jgi:hypothetical protein
MIGPEHSKTDPEAWLSLAVSILLAATAVYLLLSTPRAQHIRCPVVIRFGTRLARLRNHGSFQWTDYSSSRRPLGALRRAELQVAVNSSPGPFLQIIKRQPVQPAHRRGSSRHGLLSPVAAGLLRPRRAAALHVLCGCGLSEKDYQKR